MIRGRNVHIPTLAFGDVCVQDVPVLDRGRSLGISAIQVLKNHMYRVMYKDGSVCQRAAHISTLQRVTEEQWASLADARENSKKPVRSAVKLYY